MAMKIIIFIISIVFPLRMLAQSDFVIAQEFMSKKGITLVNNEHTKGNKSSYSVFKGKNDKGFAIIVNGAVVGYSTLGDINNIPEELDEMLNIYSEVLTRGDDDYPEEFIPRNVSPIEPLIKTRWGQYHPYNLMCPIINGDTCITGCTATALAQILYYYRLPYGCKKFDGIYNGYNNETISELPPTDFEWDDMLLEYVNNNYTSKNVNAVAKLMLYCGALGHSNYGIESTSGTINPKRAIGEEIFSQYLGYDGCDYYNTDEYPDDEMNKIMDEKLDKKIPILILGKATNGSGHWYIVDGRDCDGLFHINWGWDGSYDGYYIVSTELFKKYRTKNRTAKYCKYLYAHVPRATLEHTNNINQTHINHNDRIYNLQGRMVGMDSKKLTKGIYIKNGKKIIVK